MDDGRGDDVDDGYRQYEFLASTYGWTASQVQASITDEQLVHVYTDAAQTRVDRDDEEAYDRMVEATRLGVVYAYNPKAYQRWRRRQTVQNPRRRRSLSPAALESAMANIARQFPDNVTYGVMPA